LRGRRNPLAPTTETAERRFFVCRRLSLNPANGQPEHLWQRREKLVKIQIMKKPRIYTMPFASIYPEYIKKAEKKGRTKTEVDEIIRWLMGYSQEELESQLEKRTELETFIAEAPQLNPSRALIKGSICGVRIEEIEDPTMKEIRYMDKLIDELAKGKAMEKILRKE
jgi:hypothetical protein